MSLSEMGLRLRSIGCAQAHECQRRGADPPGGRTWGPKLLDSGILRDPWATLGGDGPDPRFKPHSLWESRCCEGAFHDRVVFSQSNRATRNSLFVLELRELTGRLVNRDPVTPFPDLLSVLEHGVHDPFEHPQSSAIPFVAPMKVQDADAILRHRFAGPGLEDNEIRFDIPVPLRLLA
jgi:hypothetical protein